MSIISGIMEPLMAKDFKSDDGSFLGGAGKFNSSGNNVPMPGEKVADVPTPPPFGGPKIWISTVLIVAALAGLFMFYEVNGPTRSHHGPNAGVDPRSDMPSLDTK